MIQIYYYRWARSKELTASPLIPDAEAPARLPSEETPLIIENRGPVGSEKSERSTLVQCLVYGGALTFVLCTGVLAWAIDEYLRKGQARPPPEEVFEWRSQLLGWISAVLYRKFPIHLWEDAAHSYNLVGARIPQICK